MKDQATQLSGTLLRVSSKEELSSSEPKQLKPLCKVALILEPTAVETDSARQTSTAIQLSNEYGKSTTCEDLKILLKDLGYQSVEILPVTLRNYQTLIRSIVQKYDLSDCVVFNLCDGCETDGYPGVSLLKEMDENGIAYTGATPEFYEITTSKPELKRYLIKEGVPTSPFVEIKSDTRPEEIDDLKSYPLIVKPSISYASISISHRSVVVNAKEALEQAHIIEGVDDGVFVERFLEGREFTALVTGSQEEGVVVHQVAERVFNDKLSKYERILAFDKYWEGYDLQGNKPEFENQMYFYAPAKQSEQVSLKDIAKRAFLAVKGSGYGRVDMRTDSMDGLNVFVLEVNANCGVSFNPKEFTSTVGEILRMSGEPISKFANDLIQFALSRRKRRFNSK